jgi:hypothetical protein
MSELWWAGISRRLAHQGRGSRAMSKIFCAHDVPNWSLFVLSLVSWIFWHEYYNYKWNYLADEEWCGCDGEGMAHKLGAEGFLCEEGCGHEGSDLTAAQPKEGDKR